MWLKNGKELIEEIHNAHNENGNVFLWRIGQCGYVIKFCGKIILIDPVLNDLTDENGKTVRLYEAPFSAADINADYVLCTHGHADHLAEETVKTFALKKRSPVFIVPAGCKKQMENLFGTESEAKVIYLKPEESAECPAINCCFIVKAISAAHPDHYYDESDSRMALSYVLQLGKKTIIHLGDTYLTEPLLNNLESIQEPDLLLPPINGDDLFRKMINFIGNMEAEEAAKLAVRIKAKLAIPTHYDMVLNNTADPNRFLNEMKRLESADKCMLLELGQQLIL
ncbi:MAG: MBL fold metallo-hydrolase [Treponema sp.]|nr:MBL fold metallo-hydrolase [Treponema sp.]